MYGLDGNDRLSGKGGNDSLNGGRDEDTLEGGFPAAGPRGGLYRGGCLRERFALVLGAQAIHRMKETLAAARLRTSKPGPVPLAHVQPEARSTRLSCRHYLPAVRLSLSASPYLQGTANVPEGYLKDAFSTVLLSSSCLPRLIG